MEWWFYFYLFLGVFFGACGMQRLHFGKGFISVTHMTPLKLMAGPSPLDVDVDVGSHDDQIRSEIENWNLSHLVIPYHTIPYVPRYIDR